MRSGSGLPEPPWTRVWLLALVVKFCADLVPVTPAVLLSVDPDGAVTTPRMVTVQLAPPFRVPPLQLTSWPDWVQVPWLEVMAYCGVAGGDWRVPTPLSWSDRTRLVSLAPPVLAIVIV